MSDTKAELRHLLRRTRATLPQPYRDDATWRVNAHIAALPILLAGRNVGAYAAHRHELNIDSALTSLIAAGVTVHFPRVTPDTAEFAPCQSLDRLVEGFAGIREPTTPAIDLTLLDVVLVPGVGFDRFGHRLGHGAGHYDRLLTQVASSCVTIGVAFAQQIVPEIPVEDHDVPMQFLLTEHGLTAAVSKLGNDE